MISELTTSDEGNCSDWIPFFEDPTQRKRGINWATFYLKDPVEAEDVFQETSMRVMSHSGIEDKPNYFLKALQRVCLTKLGKRSYLMIANAAPLDGLSSEDSKEAPMIEDSGFDSEMNDEHEKQNERYRRIVTICSQKLTDREKDLFLSRLKGCSNLEIARRRNEDVAVIRKQANALMAKMRYRCRRENKKQSGQ